ncbi:MAG: M3 family metallopeptidase [Propionibacteriales bacterium]|nr:M3 family metallopeptidase [Propionibacteriales bacterium]
MEHDRTDWSALSATDLVRRLDALLETSLDADAWVAVAAMHNEMAYRVHRHRLLGWGAAPEASAVVALVQDPGRTRALREKLALRCFAGHDDELELSRLSYLSDVGVPATREEQEAEEALAHAGERFEHDLHAVLDRLSGGRTPGTPRQRLLALASSSDQDRRTRLSRVPAHVGTKHGGLVERLDRVVDLRFARASSMGHAHPLEAVLAAGGLPIGGLDAALLAVVDAAVDARPRSGEQAGPATDTELVPPRREPGADTEPRYRLEEMLEAFGRRAGAELGVHVTWQVSGTTIVAEVERADGRTGTIVVRRGGRGPAFTTALRNRTDWPGLHQTPVACCTLDLPPGDVSLGQARVLFHELGHGLQHVLWRRRISNLAGLEYVSVERRELLSQACEFWVHRSDVVDPGRSDRTRGGSLDAAWTAHQVGVLGRAVLGWVDLQIHTQRGLGVEAALDRLRRLVDLPPDLDAVAVAASLSSPRHRARPGTAFVYPLGAARAAELAHDGGPLLNEASDPEHPWRRPRPDVELRTRPAQWVGRS